MGNITYEHCGDHIIRRVEGEPWHCCRVDIWNQPVEIGQKYQVVFYCDYDNSEHGLNYTIEVTEENLAEITFHMNDTDNDITDYILVTD